MYPRKFMKKIKTVVNALWRDPNGKSRFILQLYRDFFSPRVFLFAIAFAVSLVIPAAVCAQEQYVPLFNSSTKLEPPLIVDNPTELITRTADRGRDRHAREWMFHAYDHYLKLYWINRTVSIEIVDRVAKGGDSITFNITSLFLLNHPNLRMFFQGKGTVAQYSDNTMVTMIDPLHYTETIKYNTNERRPLKIGDRLEFEFSPFLQPPVEGRTNYYGTAMLYVVGQGGIQPWEWHTPVEQAHLERGAAIDSYPLPEEARSGGMTTTSEQYSDEPAARFDQLALNISFPNAQAFLLGRRLAHTDFLTGAHSEPDNPIFTEEVGKLGARYSASSCIQCHSATPPAVNIPLSKYLVKVGVDAKGSPHPQLGSVLQPEAAKGVAPEGSVAISGWETTDGTYGDGTPYTLRKPIYKFNGVTPAFYSVRMAISKPYGMGLLEAVDESTIEDFAIDSVRGGHMNLVPDPETGQLRVGRYGYKATQSSLKDQIAKRLNDALSITTTIYPHSDRGANQPDLDTPANRMSDADVENIYRYYALRAVPPRRNLTDEEVIKGEKLFTVSGCASCHQPTMKTGSFHPMAELRNQTIHPYTDLLVHDMGPGLADNMGEGNATGAEWRTAPLWGLGLIEPVMGADVAYLHDGRARTLNEAILWHGGWASGPKEKFRNMSADDRAALIAFLKSL